MCVVCVCGERERFIQSVAHIFALLTLSFDKQKFFILVKSNFQLFFHTWFVLIVSYFKSVCLLSSHEDITLCFGQKALLFDHSHLGL